MSDVNPTNSKSYRPGDEKLGYNRLITLTLTDRECSDIMDVITEFAMGGFSPLRRRLGVAGKSHGNGNPGQPARNQS